MVRKYLGYMLLSGNELSLFHDMNLLEKHKFVVNGFWVTGRGNRCSYLLCDDSGEPLKEYDYIQFSKYNRCCFVIESVD